MKQKYTDWIENNVSDAYRACVETTLQMQEVFPELKRVRGHYIEFGIGEHPHWWLVDPDGEIIDPTRSQFQFYGIYKEWDESQPEPTGKCPNCGKFCYNNDYCCSESCGRDYIKYCSKSWSY